MRYLYNTIDEDEPPVSHAEKVKILVVDDLPEKLLIYRSILEELEQTVITANSGEEALRQVLQHEFAVILLDVNMPGLDGFETATLIRQRKKSAKVPIIFLTAFTDDLLIAQGYASGAVDYLPMPIVPEVLRAKVRVFIELFQMRRQAAQQAEERARRKAAEEIAHRSSFLAEFSQVVAQAHSREEILRALVQMSANYLTECSIGILTDQKGDKQMIWMNGESGEVATLPSLPEIPWVQEITAEVIKSGHIRSMNNLPANPGFPPVTTATALPIRVRGETCGVFILSHQDKLQSEKKELSLASDLVSRTGVALENILLIEKIRDADRRKDEFLGMLAHELRNPLGPIRNAVQLLDIIGSKEPRLEQLKSIVDRQIRHMARLIDDLLDATRLARGLILLRQECCDLTTILRQIMMDYENIFKDSNLNLILDIPEGSLWMQGDPTRLVQTIGNLLHNAQKFTESGGTVTVTLAYHAEDRTAVLTIRDTGIGIDPTVLPYIFDVFRQAEQGLDRNRGGLGLGLALVKGLVALHHGEIDVVSAGVGKGTEFTIRFPAELHATEDAIQEQPTADEDHGVKYRILIIEDNQDAAETAELMLRHKGYDVKTAHSGFTGLEVAQTFRPQVVLCDIGLPGMDGYQVVRSIRQHPEISSAYMIALTGYGRKEDQQDAHQAGFDMHLTKPIDYNNLHQLLVKLPEKGSVAV